MNVFVSSTFADLSMHRSVLLDTLLKMGPDIRVLAMEHFGSSSLAPVDLSIAKVKQAHVYVGVLGWRYGTIDQKSNMSITEAEYRTALAKRLPLRLYFASDDYAVKPSAVETGEGAIRIQNLKEEMGNHHVVQRFTTPEDLSRRVAADLHVLLTTSEEGPKPESEPEELIVDGPIGPQVNPAHPFILCHLYRPSHRLGWYVVDMFVDLYSDRGSEEWRKAVESVDRVVYQLHETFIPALLPMQNSNEAWRVTRHVWGEFWVRAVIYFKDPRRHPVSSIRYVNLPDDCLEKRPDLMERELQMRGGEQGL